MVSVTGEVVLEVEVSKRNEGDHHREDAQPPINVRTGNQPGRKERSIDGFGTPSDTLVVPVFARNAVLKNYISLRDREGLNLPAVSDGIPVIRTVRMDTVTVEIQVTEGTKNTGVVGMGTSSAVPSNVRVGEVSFRDPRALTPLPQNGRVEQRIDRAVFREIHCIRGGEIKNKMI